MFKTVLVPVDLAHIADGSTMIEQARKIAEHNDCKMLLLNVVPVMPPYIAEGLPSGLHEQVMSRVQSELGQLAKKYDLPATTRILVRHGSPAQEILKAATECEVDLIAIASHRPGWSDFVLGSVAGSVVRHARCSVSVLRQP